MSRQPLRLRKWSNSWFWAPERIQVTFALHGKPSTADHERWAYSSAWLERFPDKEEVGGSSPPRPTIDVVLVYEDSSKTITIRCSAKNGDLAQLVEHCLCKAGVRGSIPLVSTIIIFIVSIRSTNTKSGALMSTATLHTNHGDIIVELFPNQAPKTVANFVELATGAREWVDPRTGEKTSAKLFDGTVFHRVISNFMIQGGDPLGTGTGGPGYRFADEFHPELNFDRPYLLAMANSGPGTNGSQFFITVAPTTWLNRKHSIFGEVTDAASQAVVDKIATTKTGAGDRPVQAVVIESVTISE